MKKISFLKSICFSLFCATAFPLFAAEEPSYIYYEDFSAFKPGMPAAYEKRAEIIQENGKNILRLKQGDAIRNMRFFHTPGAGYKIKLRIRFPDFPTGKNLSIYLYGTGKEKKYEYIHVSLVKSNLLVGIRKVISKDEKETEKETAQPDDDGVETTPTVDGMETVKKEEAPEKEKNLPTLSISSPRFAFTENGMEELQTNTWYDLILDIRADSLTVSLGKNGTEIRKLLENRLDLGKTLCNITSTLPTDIDFIIFEE